MNRFEQAKQITTGLTNFIKMKANIADVDIEELQKRRYEVCLSCPDRVEETDRCGICKCLLKLKTRVPEASCPASHWSEVKKV